MNAPAQPCPQCGWPVPARASEGLCPRCLVRGVLRRASAGPGADQGPRPERLPLPRRFGAYELLERLAAGGMGVVYRARQIELGRIVALKMLRAGALAGAEEVRRFRLEARAAAHLDHPHIVPIFDVGEHDGVHFFTMKLVAGGTLASRRAAVAGKDHATASVEPHLAARLLLKIARAVHHAHQRGILHRDLKPSNILLDLEGEPSVADFGLAQIAQGEDDLTLPGTLLGTPAFMAPEQASRRGGDLTTASDIYSLGAVLFFLLTGQPPFRGTTHFDTMRQVVDEEAPRPSGLNPRVDRDLETICLKCLEKEPARRYGSAEALAEDLERWLAHEPIHARPITSSERLWKWARRRPAPAAMVMISLLGVAAFMGLILSSRSQLRAERNAVGEQELKARGSAAQATQAAARAELEAGRAGRNELSAQLQLYAADIFLAAQALDAGNYGLARSALRSQLPAAGRPDFRGFEWFHLWPRSQGSQAAVLAGHTQAVAAVTFSHDGRWLVSGGRDGRVLFWNLSNRAPELVFPPLRAEEGLTEHFSMTPVFTASPEVAAMLLAGVERYDSIMHRTRPSRLGEVRALALSPDDRWLAVAAQSEFIRVWNVTNQQLAWVVPVNLCRGLVFTPDGRHLVLGDGGSEAKTSSAVVNIYDTTSHERVRHLKAAQGAFALSEDGQKLAILSSAGQVQIREFATGQVLHQWPAEVGGSKLVFSPDGTLLAHLSARQTEVIVRSVADGKERARFGDEPAHLWTLAFSRDGRRLATGGADHAVGLWELDRSQPLARWPGHGDEVLAVAFAPDNQSVVAAGRDGTVRVWENSPPPRAANPRSSRHPVFLSPSGEDVLEEPAPGQVELWNGATAQRLALPTDPPLVPLGFDGEGKSFATLSKPPDGRTPVLQFWNRDAQVIGEPVNLDPAPEDWKGVAAAPAAGLIAVGSRKGAITLYDWRSGTRRREIATHERAARRLFLSPDGRIGAAFVWPRTVQTFDCTTGALLARWRGSESEMAAFTFSPDGRLFACGGTDNRVTVLDSGTGHEVAVLRGHKAEIKALAFSPDGRTLASSSRSLTLKLWHVPTWRELATLADDKPFTFLAFSADGTTLFAGEYHQSLQRFLAPPTSDAW